MGRADCLPFNRNCPLGGASHLFERWRLLCGHFVRLFGVHSPAMNASQPCKLPRKPARHHLKPQWTISVQNDFEVRTFAWHKAGTLLLKPFFKLLRVHDPQNNISVVFQDQVTPRFAAPARRAHAADGSGFWGNALAPAARRTGWCKGRLTCQQRHAPCAAGRR